MWCWAEEDQHVNASFKFRDPILTLSHANSFYAEKLAEATRKFATLNNDLKISLDAVQKNKSKPHQALKKQNLPGRKIQEFKLAFSEFYLSLILLQNYQNLNHTGFRKILKKHDKLLRVDIGGKWQKEKVETSHFFVNRDIDKIIDETEQTVTTLLEGGDRQKAMKRLRVPPLGKYCTLILRNILFIVFSIQQAKHKVLGRLSKLVCSRGAS